MTDGSSKTLAITDLPDNVDATVMSMSVAISSDGRLVAAGSFDAVRHLNWMLVWILNARPIGYTYLGCPYW